MPACENLLSQTTNGFAAFEGFGILYLFGLSYKCLDGERPKAWLVQWFVTLVATKTFLSFRRAYARMS